MSNNTSNSMLTSDSKGSSATIWDSRQITWDDFAYMVEEYLFSYYLTIMDKYLTVNGYTQYKNQFKKKIADLEAEFSRVKNLEWSGKYTVVDGQVILIKKSEVPSGESPLGYLQEHWNITSDFKVTQIEDCMLRGVTEVTDQPKKLTSNATQNLNSENIPQHMHQDAITTGSGVKSLVPDKTQTTLCEGEYKYDMFNNDSFSTGLDKNELDGTVDEFTVQNCGSETVSHNNLPKMEMYYAFLISSATA